MTQSTTGTGLGSCGKYTSKELATLANSLNILVAGKMDTTEDIFVNPPMASITVTLDPPLPGSSDNYTVLITGLNTGNVYVATMTDNDAGDFSEFMALAESEGTCMYAVLKNGIRPNLP